MPQTEIRNLPAELIEARILPAQQGADASEFEVLFSTGAKVRRYDWNAERVYEEALDVSPEALMLDRINQGAAPVLDSHRAYTLDNVIGRVMPGSVRFDSGKVYARVKMDDGPETSSILRKIRSGIISNVSVGYSRHKIEKNTDVNPAVYTVKRWEPLEISFVPVPADPGAGMRRAAADTYPCEFTTLNRKDDTMPQDTELTETAEAKTAKTKATKTRAADPEPTEEPTPPPAEEAAIRAATQAERKRLTQVRSMARDAGLDEAAADALAARGLSVEQSGLEILTRLKEKQTQEQGSIRTVRAEVVEDEHDKFLRGAGDWLVRKAGSGVTKIVEEHTKQKIEPGEFRGMSLLRLAEECLTRRGVKTRGMSKMELVGEAFTHRSAITQSTSDFAVLLENTLHKVLLAAYAMTPDTWTRFCATGTVSDFRAHNRYRQGTFGTLDQVNEAGEFKNKGIPDGHKESITAVTKGNIINLSRQTIINDDMGAFNDLATRLGRAAKLSVEVDVYALLKLNAGLGPTMSDGDTLFHANHNNLGTGAALSAASLDADRVVMGTQTDPSGNEILDLTPAVLVLPKGLGGQARVINLSQYDPDTLANKSQMKPNVVAGLFSDIVDTGRLTGTRRYLFANPAIAPTLEVAFLDGQQDPYLESQMGWRVDGTEWKVRLDYGTAAIDWRGAVTNAGA